MAETATNQHVDVDDLARDKVQEIENLLDSSEHKLNDLNSWFSILKQIITAADLHRTNDERTAKSDSKAKTDTGDSIYADYGDDNERFNAADLTEQFATNPVKWTIRVRAFKLVHRLVHKPKNPTLRQLSDLVRLSFVAATSPYDDLKIQGFEMFRYLINRFHSVEEREYPGHSTLEQYKTQVISALKPAFNLDAPPYITAIACQVCCLWICRGLEREPNDIKRAYQIMKVTIVKLENQGINQNSKLYTESELEQERLNILGAWAQLYVTAEDLLKNPTQTKLDGKLLHELVVPQISSLIDKFWELLRDYALLIMPASRVINISHDNEHVYTRDVALKLFEPVWPTIILAVSMWLCSDRGNALPSCNNNDSPELSSPNTIKSCDNLDQISPKTPRKKYLRFVCGILMKELCRCQSYLKSNPEPLPESTVLVLRSLLTLVNHDELRMELVEDLSIAKEFYMILYGILANLAKTSTQHQLILKNLLQLLFNLMLLKLSNTSQDMNHCFAYLLDSIRIDLKNWRYHQDQGAGKLDLIKKNLQIRLIHSIAMVKGYSSILDEQDLKDAFLHSLKVVYSLPEDPTFGISMLEVTRDLRSSVSPQHGHHMMRELFNSKSEVVSNLLSRIYRDESMDKEHTIQTLVYVEAHLRSMKTDIHESDEEDKPLMITSYTRALLEPLSELLVAKTAEQSGQILPCRRGLLDFASKHIKTFENNIPSDVSDLCASLEMVLQAIKSANELKRNGQTERTSETGKNKAKKPTTKIVLKADFSNFYTKKA